MSLKNKKFRVLPNKDEPLHKMIAKTYSETYTKYDKLIEDGIRGAPAKIKASRYYNAKLWFAIFGIIFLGAVVMILQKGLDEKQSLINEYKANIAAADEILSQPQYVLSEESFQPAVDAANAITEILNKYLVSDTIETDKELHEWLGGDCISDAYNWGKAYSTSSNTYTWYNYINWAETDEDVICIIFVLKDAETKPVRYEICDYKISENKLISREELNIA